MKKPKSRLPVPEVDVQKLIYELEAQKIELELQNIELRLAKEQAAELATEKYLELYDFAPSGYFTLSKEGKIIELNLCGAQMLGKERLLLKNSWFGFFVSNDTKPAFNLFLEKVFISKAKETCELTLITNRNLPMFVHVASIITENGEQCLVMLVDITGLKQTEKALRASEKKFNDIITNLDEGFYSCTLDGLLLEYNLSFMRILGIGPNYDMRGVRMPDFWQNPEERLEYLDKLMNEGFIRNYVVNSKTMSGEKTVVMVNSHLVNDENGKAVRIEGTIVDFTERKRAEEALAQQSDALSKLNHFSMELSMLLLEDNLEALIAKRIKEFAGAEMAVFTEYNPANRTITPKHIEMEPGLLEKVVSLLGKQVSEIHSVISDEMYRKMTTEIIGMRRTLHEASFGAIPRPVGAAIQALLKVDRFIGLAYLIDGKLYGTSLLAMSKGQPDPPKQLLENFTFLATVSLRRKRTEEKLRENQKKFNDIVTNLDEGFYSCTLDGLLLDQNLSFKKIFGFDPNQDMKGIKIPDLWLNPKERSKYLGKLMHTGFIRNYLVNSKTISGEKIVVMVNSHLVKDEKGKFDRIEGTIADFTERTRIEKKLEESEIQFRQLFENMSSGVAIYEVKDDGNDFIFKNFNHAAEKIDKVKKEKVIGKSVLKMFPGVREFGLYEVFQRVWKTGKSEHHPVSFYQDEKIAGWRENYVYKLLNGEIVAIYNDVTERKQAEADNRRSKEILEQLHKYMTEIRENERAAISREIHDQLGQSMTALKLDMNWLLEHAITNLETKTKITGMIDLITAAIRNVQRISSELRPGILDDLGLAAAIEWYAEEFENRTKIHVIMEMDEVQTSNDMKNLAIFRVMQESLTNVIRHAFAKTVRIALHETDQHIVLEILDDGIGISEEKIKSNKSLGIIGMQERIKQSGGQMEIAPGKAHGTLIRVQVPVHDTPAEQGE